MWGRIRTRASPISGGCRHPHRTPFVHVLFTVCSMRSRFVHGLF